jgi:hypothetical protein
MPSASIEFDLVNAVATQGVSEAVKALPAFPQKYLPERNIVTIDTDLTIGVIKLCVETNNADRCRDIFAKMREERGRDNWNHRDPEWKCYKELCAALAQYLPSAPWADAHFRFFFLDAVDAMLSGTLEIPVASARTSARPSEFQEYAPMIVMAARHAGGIQILKDRYEIFISFVPGGFLTCSYQTTRGIPDRPRYDCPAVSRAQYSNRICSRGDARLHLPSGP